jgi:2-polyprenyl-3-methyl-5-hydroxy-6-metoxy-1,4-benzoquinol methylase
VTLSIHELRSSRWAPEDLESLDQCPVCGGSRRELLYGDLWDNSALSAPGQWSLFRCDLCGSAYVDPRPTRESIGRAYDSYYTHEQEGPTPASYPRGRIRQLKFKLANGYRNDRFGTDSEPSYGMGAILGMAFPMLRRASDFQFRYLPNLRTPAPKVLDIGCGSGQWLSQAATTRWQVFGAEPDAQAFRVARQRGFDVRKGGIDAWNDRRGYFDAVTLSHVIEHVHDPRQMLAAARDLLRPGGQLYVETPNIEALSHGIFGRAWRGLEAPRHLVLFNRRSLIRLLREVGFESIRQRPAPSQLNFIIAASRELSELEPVARSTAVSNASERWLRFRSRFTRKRTDFLTLTCSRPR